LKHVSVMKIRRNDMILFTVVWMFGMCAFLYKETNNEIYKYIATVIVAVVVVAAEWLMGC